MSGSTDGSTAAASGDAGRVVILAVCGMEKKVSSQPMKEILQRLQHPNLKVIVFSEQTVLNDPIDQWPVCHCLLAFFSLGFPLDKAIAYTKLRNPMLINNLESQYDLLDRRVIYEKLSAAGVPIPDYRVLNRKETIGNNWDEQEDVLTIDFKVVHKPFVEKPVSAEDHNIHIYFPSGAGGGCQKLFRKVEDRSSRYSGESRIRKEGSYIYEEFLATDGTDVKVYTVGPDYAHAEARKSPGLDGKVQRDNTGKEKRFPVILNANEKLIARKVCNTFSQTICGFDLLRCNGQSYVCDVNGFSFVKSSSKYYDDCAQILKEMIFSKLAPELFPSILPSVEYLAEEVPVPIPTSDSGLELRCVVAVIRHGDRTPKQKMKMIVTHEKFFTLFEKYDVKNKLKIKLKTPRELQEVLDIARDLLEEVHANPAAFGDEAAELDRKLRQLKTVLEMYGYFSGINRKVQFRVVDSPDPTHDRALLMILKWGGELTPTGRSQAEELGNVFRCIYPGGEGEYGSLPGSGFLRLHSTYRHDLKVYASDEGRVQMTAAAFVKGLLDLEGNLPSILFHLVQRNHFNKFLDNAVVAEESMARVKKRLHAYMRTDSSCVGELRKELAPTQAVSYMAAMDAFKNPVTACQQLYDKILALTQQLSSLEATGKEVNLYLKESLNLMMARWGKLEKDFKSKDGKFDISKIPDIYDCIKYDMLHNGHLGLNVAYDLYMQSVFLADLVMPQEYGITQDEKLEIAENITRPLLHKIKTDFTNTLSNSDILHQLDPQHPSGVVTPKRHVRTRLYFTSESNIHSLVNMLRFGPLCDLNHPDWKMAKSILDTTPELNYMTQIVLLLFENFHVPEESDQRFMVEIHFSPGAKGRDEIITNGEIELEFKKKIVPLKRMLPDSEGVKSLHLEPKYKPTCTTSLPALLSDEAIRVYSPSLKGSEPDLATGRAPTSTSMGSGQQLQSDEEDTTDDFIKDCKSLAQSVQPLQQLCSISLAQMLQFLGKTTENIC